MLQKLLRHYFFFFFFFLASSESLHILRFCRERYIQYVIIKHTYYALCQQHVGTLLATACYARRGLYHHFDVIDLVSYLYIYLFV